MFCTVKACENLLSKKKKKKKKKQERDRNAQLEDKKKMMQITQNAKIFVIPSFNIALRLIG